MSEKYIIIFDANILFPSEGYDLSKIFNSHINDVANFIKDNNITDVFLAIPQIVIDERLIGNIKKIRECYDAINSNNRKLNCFKKTKTKKFNLATYKQKLNKGAKKLIRDCNIKIIPTVEIDQKILLKRALNKVAPFLPLNKSDKGFKDTVMWISILNYVKENKEYKYILMTNDGAFSKDGAFDKCKEEFETYSSDSEFLIKTTIDDLKVFLDEKFLLELDLKKTYQEIKENILSRYGTLTMKIKKYFENKTSYYPPILRVSDMITVNAETNLNTKSFDLKNIEVNKISKRSDDIFIIDLNVEFKETPTDNMNRYGGVVAEPSIDYLGYPFGGFRNDELKYNVILQYNKKTNDINIDSVFNIY
ncbi:MAG: PIN domain-containing protein [Candidatus Pacebacteria bacterium]|nr:PIN domain-containing protein [Candidatus Paceibacterota bacterium]